MFLVSDLEATLEVAKQNKADLTAELTDVNAAFALAESDIGSIAEKLVIMTHIWKVVCTLPAVFSIICSSEPYDEVG